MEPSAFFVLSSRTCYPGVKKIIERLRDVQYPRILSFPRELLGEIFLHCLETVCVPPKSWEMPFVLANVCAEWRTVALGLAPMWARLVVESGFANSQAERLNRIFDRSRGHPLEIEVEPRDVPAMLVGQSDRWTNFRGRIEQLVDWSAPLAVPNLVTLELDTVCRNISERAPGCAGDGVRASPFVAPRQDRRNIGPSKLHLPWHQIPFFGCLSGFDSFCCYEVLRAIPNVQELTEASYPETLTLHHFRFLVIESSDESDKSWMRRLIVPSLVYLDLSEFDSGDADAMTSFILRSQCKLKTLVVRCIKDGDRLRDLLRHMPSLETLALKGSTRQGSTIMDGALFDPGIPSLRQLHIEAPSDRSRFAFQLLSFLPSLKEPPISSMKLRPSNITEIQINSGGNPEEATEYAALAKMASAFGLPGPAVAHSRSQGRIMDISRQNR